MYLLLGLSLVLLTGAQGNLFEYPKHDGQVRTYCSNLSLSEDLIHNLTVLVVRDNGRNCPSQLEMVAEQLAQVLSEEIRVCIVEPFQEIIPNSKPGEIHILTRNKTYQYFGTRSTSKLVSFLRKTNVPSLIPILTKKDKDIFEAFPDDVKVVGYFLEHSLELKAFEEAANSTNPYYTKFFYVSERALAKKFKLTQIGQIILIHPRDNSYAISPIVSPQTKEEIVAFVEKNRYPVFKLVSEENLHDPNLVDPQKALVAFMGKTNCKHHKEFEKQTRRLLKNLTAQNHAYLKSINFIRVDSSILPATLLKLKTLARNPTPIPEKLPFIIYINFQKDEFKWLDLPLLEIQDKTATKALLNNIKEWLKMILKEDQFFVSQPQSQTLARGDKLELNCQLKEVLGDCLWYHNNLPIGYTLPASHHYSWKIENSATDCSLVIHEFTPERDEGEWRCEVIGQSYLVSDTALLTTLKIEDMLLNS